MSSQFYSNIIAAALLGGAIFGAAHLTPDAEQNDKLEKKPREENNWQCDNPTKEDLEKIKGILEPIVSDVAIITHEVGK